MNNELTPTKIMEVGFAFWGSRTLLTAVELGVFTALGKKPMKLEELRREYQFHQRGARDFFDALVAMGFLQREGETYRNTPESEQFLDKAKPSYCGGILEMCSTRLYGFWNTLADGLRTGMQQNEAKKGENIFGLLYENPTKLKEFLTSMTGLSRAANQAIARRFSWKEYKTFADVGTAQGDLAVQIALANPHLQGIGYDLAAVENIFSEYVAKCGVKERLKFQKGNFFEQAFPKVDVITMGHILHDWNLEEKKLLIRKAYEALPAGGAVIIYDALIDDERKKNAFGLLMSLNMLIETSGGFDYSGKDCQGWLKEAGFKSTRVEHLYGPDSMTVGIK